MDGYVVSNAGRSRYIFKQHVGPGSRIPLKLMYKKYKNKYKGDFDEGFLVWLQENKIPDDFEIVVNKETMDELEEPVKKEEPVRRELDIHPERRFVPNKMTPKEISELKIKDNPKNIISRVMSVHKLRRALTLCKDRPGKGTLTKLIRQRINELK